MKSRILNREFQHPADGWYQIEALGDHPHAGTGLIQVIDEAACDSVVKHFNADAAAGRLRHGHELLIDHEHFSEQPDQETRAYGWLQELQRRLDGIYGRIRWTATGQTAVDGGDYRFFSTEYDPRDLQVLDDGQPRRARPTRLAGLTLTNMNNNRGQKPITNRGGAPGSDPARRQTPMQNKEKCTHLNADGTFKGGFDGCVLHLRTCEGHSEESARKICGKIAQRVMNRVGGRPLPRRPADGKCPACGVAWEASDDDGIHVCPQCNTTFAGPSSEASSGGGVTSAPNQQQNTRNKMKNVATKLGLADEAGEDSILAAVTRLQNRVGELEPLAAENSALKNRFEQVDAETIGALLAEHHITDARVINRLTPLLKSTGSREERMALLADLGFRAGAPTAATQTRILNRGTVPLTTAETGAEDPQTRARKISNRAEELKSAAPQRSFDACWSQAQREMIAKH